MPDTLKFHLLLPAELLQAFTDVLARPSLNNKQILQILPADPAIIQHIIIVSDVADDIAEVRIFPEVLPPL